MRAERNAEEAEARLEEKDPSEWTDADHKFLQLMMRYQASRERTFHRAWRAFEQLRKDRLGEALAILRLKAQVNADAEREAKYQQEDVNPSSPAQAKIPDYSRLPKRPARTITEEMAREKARLNETNRSA